MGLFGDKRFEEQLARHQAEFDAWMRNNQERLNKLYAEQKQHAELQQRRSDEIEALREQIIRRQLRLVEQWEQLYPRVERIVQNWEARSNA
jgi:predicted Rossmann fold nucleotide-binding protein DprA/Smf involved in DNA uptake